MAQSAPGLDELHPIGKYTEMYLQNPKVSGSLLVGLRWAGPDGNYDPHNIRLSLPTHVPGSRACVDVVSKDGRYTAENLYAVASTSRQVLLNASTQFEQELNDYQAGDVGIIVHAGSDCESEEGGIIPALVVPLHTYPGSGREGFIADINADPELVSAKLVNLDGVELPARSACVAAGGGVHIAYSSVCTITPTSDLPRSAIKLRLLIKERFTTVNNDFTLLLP